MELRLSNGINKFIQNTGDQCFGDELISSEAGARLNALFREFTHHFQRPAFVPQFFNRGSTLGLFHLMGLSWPMNAFHEASRFGAKMRIPNAV